MYIYIYKTINTTNEQLTHHHICVKSLLTMLKLRDIFRLTWSHHGAIHYLRL
jgi:hypothetical protein